MIPNRRATCCLALLLLIPLSGLKARADAPVRTAENGNPPLTIATLGDSITKGVRTGVTPEETFSSLAEQALKAKGLNVKVVNLGVGGERTDQGLLRLDQVLQHKPRVVAVMYGTNDSYVDAGKTDSRISIDAFRSNLRTIVEKLLLEGIEPILMTAPREAPNAPKNGLGEDRNVRLAPFMDACREVAKACDVPLVDHFARWTEAEKRGQSLRDWTTDGYHPNPAGHRDLAEALVPALLRAEPAQPDLTPARFEISVDTVLKSSEAKGYWYHPRVAAIPNQGAPLQALMTVQKHLGTSDHYSGMSTLTSDNLGRSWSEPKAIPELDWVREPAGVDVAVADVTPGWHTGQKKVIAVGAQVRYSAKGQQLEDQARSNQTAYAVFDPKAGTWSRWQRLEMPKSKDFNFARSACAQFVVEPDGSVLLPFYIGTSAKVPYSVTVVRCAFDGSKLTYVEHGDVLSLNVARGLYEPSLIKSGGHYYLTIRNDLKGYVTRGNDGLHYRPVKAWTFDDGQELGSYNTQQHWLAHGDDLFLVYTRRGFNNDHIVRHRAPLFIAQVDPERLRVVRATERVVVPEQGAELGNFGASAITRDEAWVTVGEGTLNLKARPRETTKSAFVARVRWTDAHSKGDAHPDPKARLDRVRQALREGKPTRVVCFGDSVTGLYYHTGGRQAYTDLLGQAIVRAEPKAKVKMINAGISGHTTQNALQRIDRDVLSHAPDVVTVAFGLNDLARLPIKDYRKNLAEIVEKCRARGAEVILCTPNNVNATPARPLEGLVRYADVVRSVARELDVPLCDLYANLEKLKARDPMGWRLLMSDEIHPNLEGHRKIAEFLAQTLTDKPVSLSDAPLPTPALPRTQARINQGLPVKVIAMTPYHQAVTHAFSNALVQVTPWSTENRTLNELYLEAGKTARAAKPHLVLLAIPRKSTPAEASESFLHDYAWVMNLSLSFGPGGWDCVVVHPSVSEPGPDSAQPIDETIRKLVRAQGLPLIDRAPGDQRPGEEIVGDWLRAQTQSSAP